MAKVWRVGGSHFMHRSAPDFAPKQPDTYRIFFLGDSFTYGQGVTNESATFVKRTVARLNERRPRTSKTEYEAYNGGIPGSLTPHWVGLCDAVLDSYDPDLVVAVFFLRDGGGTKHEMGPADAPHLRHCGGLLFRHSVVPRLVTGESKSDLDDCQSEKKSRKKEEKTRHESTAPSFLFAFHS